MHTGSDPLYSGDHIFPLQIPDSDSIFFEDITLGIFIAQCMQNDPVAFIGAYEQLDGFFPLSVTKSQFFIIDILHHQYRIIFSVLFGIVSVHGV